MADTYNSRYTGEQIDTLLSIIPELSNNATEANKKIQNINTLISNKVDKQTGKQLSTEDYTTEDKALLYGYEAKIMEKVDKVDGKGLSTEDYTTEDKNKLYDYEGQINSKVDKIEGKQLSTEDYTTEEKNKLSFLAQNIKEVPEGVSYDELVDDGIYVNQTSYSKEYIIVGRYTDINSSLGGDVLSSSQTRIYVKYDNTVKIQNRYYIYDTKKWTEWKDVFANVSYVDSINKKILDIIDSAPEALNTLNELATALNNDPGFAATVINQLEGKVDKIEGMGLSEVNYTTDDQQMLYGNNIQISELENSMTNKVDKVDGKGLSEANFSTQEKSFLNNIKDINIASKEDIVNANNELIKSTSNSLANIAKGNAIRIDDVSPNKHTIQVMARGKNLFGLIGRSKMSFGEFDSTSKRTFTGKGIYYAVSGSNYYKEASAIITDNDNSIKITTTDAWYGVGIDIKVRPSTTYTLSGEIPEGSYIAISQYDSEGEHIGYSHYDSNSTFVTSSQTSWILAIMINEIANSESIFKNIQLEEGDVASYYKQCIDPATITVKRLKKNLIPYPYTESTVNKNGIIFNVSESGVIKVTGMAEETTSFAVSNKNNGGLYLIKGQSYFFSCVTSNSSLDSYYAFVSDANGDNYFDTGKGVVVTPQASGYASVYIVVKKDVNLSSVVYKPMLEVGITRSEFERYDSKDYNLNESGIVNVDSLSPTITFLVTNPLIDIEASYNQDINVPIKLGEQNEQLIHEVQKRQFKKVAHGKEITLTDSCYSNLENLTLYGRTTQDDTPTHNSPVPFVSIGDKGSITVQVGNESESQTLKIPIRVPLYGLPVSSGGNFVDSDGKQWLCNVIDLAKGVYIQKVAIGEVAFSSYGRHPNGIPYGVVNLPLKIPAPSIGMLCEKAMYVSNQGVVADTFYENNSNCVFNGSDNETKEDLINKYKGCKIMYALKDEVVLPLNSEIMEFFRSIYTYKPTTYIKSVELADMDVEYYVDIPAYVGNQIAQIPTGGGGEWTLLIDYITSEQIFTPEINHIVFTEDDNGNPLSCSAIYVEINGKLFRENSNDISYRLYLNTNNNLIQCTKIKNGEYAVTGVYVGKRGNGRATVYTHSTGVTFYAPYTIEYQDESITSVKITGNNYNETHLDAGASIRIYGMR